MRSFTFSLLNTADAIILLSIMQYGCTSTSQTGRITGYTGNAR